MDKTVKSRALKTILVLLFLAFIFFVTMLLIWEIFKFSIIIKTFNYIVTNIINVSGMSVWLAKGIVVFLLIPFFWALGEIFKIRFKINIFKKNAKRSYKKLGIIVVISYVGLFFLSMYFLGRGTYFGHTTGETLKWYANTPEGVRFFDSPGYDPKYGIKLKPVSQDMMLKYQKKTIGMRPKRINIEPIESYEFFDPITGEPKVWYYLGNDGNYELFDSPGYHPTYNKELKPITPEIVRIFQKKEEQKKKLEEEKKRFEEEKKKEELINETIENGKEYFEQAKYTESQQYFLKVLEISPGNVESEEYLQRIEEAIKQTLFENIEMGKKYLEKGLFEDAKNNFEKVLISDPNNLEAKKYLLFFEGIEFFKKADFNECISRLQRLIMLDPSFSQATQYLELAKSLNLAINKYDSGSYEECINIMQKVLEIDPENINAKSYIAQCQRELELVINPFYGISIEDCIINPKRHQIYLPLRNRVIPLQWTSGTKGVQIKNLHPKSLAYKAGLKEGDVIFKINNVNISNVEKFFEKIPSFQLRPGSSIKINFYNGNGTKELIIRRDNL